MKKLILVLAAFCMAFGSLASPALAMGFTNVPAANEPVSPADLAAFKSDFTALTTCITAQGKNDAFAADPRYRTMFQAYTDATKAAQTSKNNRPMFLQFRASYNTQAAAMAATYGCTTQVTPLSDERA